MNEELIKIHGRLLNINYFQRHLDVMILTIFRVTICNMNISSPLLVYIRVLVQAHARR